MLTRQPPRYQPEQQPISSLDNVEVVSDDGLLERPHLWRLDSSSTIAANLTWKENPSVKALADLLGLVLER